MLLLRTNTFCASCPGSCTKLPAHAVSRCCPHPRAFDSKPERLCPTSAGLLFAPANLHRVVAGPVQRLSSASRRLPRYSRSVPSAEPALCRQSFGIVRSKLRRKRAKVGKNQTQEGTMDGESSLQWEIGRLRQENDYLRCQREILKKPWD